MGPDAHFHGGNLDVPEICVRNGRREKDTC